MVNGLCQELGASQPSAGHCCVLRADYVKIGDRESMYAAVAVR